MGEWNEFGAGERAPAAMGRREQVDIHTWFSLSYASYLVVNRSILQSMPEEWQHQFTALLDEMHDRFGHLPWPTYDVRVRGENGRYEADPIPHYNRGRTYIEPRVEDWCLKHDRPVTNRFVAAVCPNEPGCRVVPRPTDNGSCDGGPA